MKYDVELIPQSTAQSCWAASIAMVRGWRDRACFDPAQIAANPGGPSYMPAFAQGLDPNDRAILEANGFAFDAPQCYSLQAVQQLIDAHGPLWVAGAAPSPHVRVVTGYDGDMLLINDPWPVDRGTRQRVRFSDFFGQMETLGARERNEPSPIYVAWAQ